MSTTSIVVELLVVGFLGFLALAPVTVVAGGWEMSTLAVLVGELQLPFQLAAAYVFGIIWNRVCDQCFHHVDIRIIRRYGYTDRAAFQLARTHIIQSSVPLREHLSYFRNLIRVSRATTISAAAYCLVFPFAPLLVAPFISSTRQGMVFLILIDVLLFGAGFAWFKLEDGYVATVRDSQVVLTPLL